MNKETSEVWPAEEQKTSTAWLAEFNADWARNISKRIYCKHEATEEEALEYAEKIKHKFGDPEIETIVVGVKPI